MATITVDTNTDLQTVLSFAAGQDVGTLDYPVSGENYRDGLLDAAVDSGLNGVHMTIQISEVENTTDYFQAWMDVGQDEPHAARDAWITSNGAPVNDDADPDTFTMSGFKWGRITDTMNKVVLPMRTKLAARGETLFLSFVPGHTSLSNQYFVDNPAEYGEWVLAVYNRFNSTYGFFPDAWEILGEPDHGDRQITPAELVAMMAAARTRILAAGYPEPIWMAPGTVSGPAARQYYLDMVTADAATAGHLKVLTYHRYVNIDDTALGNLKTTASTDGKLGTGMTEFDAGYDLIDLWSDLKVGHGVIGAAISFGYPSSTDTGHLFYPTGTGSAGDLPINKVQRVKYMEHIWRYVRRGAVGKSVSVGGTGAANVSAMAFELPNGKHVIVAKCAAAVDIDISGIGNGTYEIRYTTGNFTTAPSAYDQSLTDEVVTTGSTGTISMPGAGIITIFDQGYLTPLGYQLYVSKNGGAYALIGTEVQPFDSTNLTDQAVTTNRLGAGTGSFTAGEVSEDGDAADFALAANNYTELLFSATLQASLLADADTLSFRVYHNGAPLDTYTVTPQLTVIKAMQLAGASAGTSTATADVQITKNLAATSAGTSTASADVQVTKNLAASVAGTSTASADLSLDVTISLAGTSVGTSTIGGTLLVTKNFAGSTAGTGTATASISLTHNLAGASAGVATALADLTVTEAGSVLLAGTSNGVATATATAQLTKSLAGASAGTGTALATLSITHRFAGTSAGTSTATGDLLVIQGVPLAGTSAGTSTASAVMAVTKSLAASSVGTATALADLQLTLNLSGAVNGTSTATASWSVIDPTYVFPLQAPLTMVLDAGEHTMLLDANEGAMLLNANEYQIRLED